MSSGLYTARQALKLGCALGAFSTMCAFGRLADANVSDDAALHARMRPLASRIGGDLSDAALARALGVDPQALRAAGGAPGMDLAPSPLLAPGVPDLDPGANPEVARRINAATPFGDAVPTSARPFIVSGSGDNQKRALTCLTQAVYFEAASEGDDGERAVAQVVLNRVRNDLFPHSVCGVVYQGSSLSTGCQFSFTCDGSLNRPVAAWAWDRARRIAADALHGQVFAGVGLATHYHADYVAPWWMTHVAKVAQIGAHIFYRWPGALGQPAAFNARYSAVERFGAPPAPAPDPDVIAPEQPQVAAAQALRRSADGRVHAEFQLAASGIADAPAGGYPAGYLARAEARAKALAEFAAQRGPAVPAEPEKPSTIERVLPSNGAAPPAEGDAKPSAAAEPPSKEAAAKAGA